MKLLHYGLQRSGTNYFESLLKRTFSIKFLNSNRDRSSPKQKHFRLYAQKDIIPEPQYRNNLNFSTFEQFSSFFNDKAKGYIIVSKDPYSWFLSYQNWAQKCSWPEVEHHYIEEYNHFYRKWLEFSKESTNIHFVRYIDLLTNKDMVLQEIKDKFNLKESFWAKFRSMKLDKVPQSESFTKDKLDYYLNHKYLLKFDDESLNLLNKNLDVNVVKSLGYEVSKCI